MIKRIQLPQNSALIFNRIFLSGLLLLLLNDHYLKWEFSNWITGKLSDLTGLLTFPMFLQFLFPRFSRRRVILVTAVLFIFWKLPVSDPFIVIYNRAAIIPITRTVDYSDLMALAVLPLAGYFIKRIDRYRIGPVTSGFFAYVAVIPIALIFMATSPPISYYMRRGGDIYIGKYYRLKIPREQALTRLKAEGFPVEPDTLQHERGRAYYFVMNNVVLDGGKDTLEAIHFGLLDYGDKSMLLINSVKLKDTTNSVRNWRLLRRYYRRLIRSEIVEEVK